MNLLRSVLPALLALALPTLAQADTVNVYAISSATIAFTGGGGGGGFEVQIDITTNQIIEANATFGGGGPSGSFYLNSGNLSGSSLTDATGIGYISVAFTSPAAPSTNSSTDFFDVFGSPASGYQTCDGTTCTVSSVNITSGPYSGTNITITGDQALTYEGTYPLSTGTAATPEPSSLILLGTGTLSLAAAARRRLTRA